MGIAAALLLAVGVYYLPPVHSRLAWRIEELRTRLKYAFNPPEEAVFVPTQRSAATATPSPIPSLTPTRPGPTQTPAPTSPPTVTSTPLPAAVILQNITYIDEHGRWNYCGPANLAMALTFWGWKGTRDDIGAIVKPGENNPDLDFITRGKTDKNVMPYELTGYVQEHTDLNVVLRHGGEMDLLKRMIAAGFPVIVEKGYYTKDYTGKMGWLGHYVFVTGYDEARGGFIVQDAWLEPGKNLLSPYDVFEEGWRSFDFLFMVVYPPGREAEVFSQLGPWADNGWANQHALDIANTETQTLAGIDGFFAWFNAGTSRVRLQQYADAATAYDQAFALYAQLGNDNKQRPYRMMWYQTGPYWAYFYTGRYQDVIGLADQTLNETVDKPTLEESLYWRALAEYALGQTDAAFADLRQAVYLNKNFQAGLEKLQEWGISP
jgi:hypothetical protein